MLKSERGIATIFLIILIFLGVVVVGAVVAGAVILTNDVAITVTNQSCGTIDIAKGSAALGFNFLPGINVPSEIEEGDTVVVQVPKMFVNTIAIAYGYVEVSAFNRSFAFGTSHIDMQNSTWDGVPLNSVIGQQVEISGEHTLVLECP